MKQNWDFSPLLLKAVFISQREINGGRNLFPSTLINRDDSLFPHFALSILSSLWFALFSYSLNFIQHPLWWHRKSSVVLLPFQYVSLINRVLWPLNITYFTCPADTYNPQRQCFVDHAFLDSRRLHCLDRTKKLCHTFASLYPYRSTLRFCAAV